MFRRSRGSEAEVEHLEHEVHVDLEGLTLQLRALSRAIEALAHAIEAHAGGDGPAPEPVMHDLDRARWELRAIW